MDKKWDLRFLELAKYYASYSKDPSTKVGAVIVNPQRRTIVSAGYNGFPRFINDSPKRYENRELKYKIVAHAEVNAIIEAGRQGKSVEGCTIYVWPTLMTPSCCNDCTKYVIQAGISRLVQYDDTGHDKSRWVEQSKITEMMLREASVKVDIYDNDNNCRNFI